MRMSTELLKSPSIVARFRSGHLMVRSAERRPRIPSSDSEKNKCLDPTTYNVFCKLIKIIINCIPSWNRVVSCPRSSSLSSWSELAYSGRSTWSPRFCIISLLRHRFIEIQRKLDTLVDISKFVALKINVSKLKFVLVCTTLSVSRLKLGEHIYRQYDNQWTGRFRGRKITY